MADIKETVKGNLIRLRRDRGYTQLELAGKINYSDKAVSRWETGEVTPDIETIAALADLYGVPITTFFLTPEEQAEKKNAASPASPKARKTALLVLAISLLWAAALSLFFIFNSYANAFCAIVWGVPATMLLLALYFHVGGHTVTRTVFLSLFLWTALVATYLQIGIPAFFPILFLGLPLEALVILFPYLARKKV